MGVLLCCQNAVTGGHGIQIPAFTVEDDVGMALMYLVDDLIDGIDIQQTNQIEAETVEVVFVRPVAD